MCRIIRSKWFLGALFALPMVSAPAVIAFLVRAPAELGTLAGGSSEMRKLVATVPDRTVTEELQDVSGGAERRRRAYEEAARRALDRYNTWQGTSAALSQGALIESREGYETVLRVFNADPPAPQGRLREFSGYVGENPEYKVVAWGVRIDSVTPDGRGGWKATVRVGATLATLRGGVPFTPYETLETWQIDNDGSAKALDVRPGDKPHFLIVD